MQTKAYFASSVPAALEAARQDLGENAMLIGSRPAPIESRRFGRLEVTFAYDAEPGGRSWSEPSEMEDIRAQLAALRKAVGRSDRLLPASVSPMPEENPHFERLLERGFSGQVAAELAAGAARRGGARQSSGNWEAAMLREIAERIAVAPFVEMAAGECRTLAFVGPPGRGKTTSLVKIAVKLGLARRVPVRIYSAGAHAIGGQEQIARYAAILGTPFQCCESLASLNLALNGDGWKGLLLIDTPGLSPADRGDCEELTRFFAGRPEIEKHLVLRADAGTAEMSRTISRFAALGPSRLLFTGLDEVDRPVAAVEALISSGIAATFCGTGQQIPEDLEGANIERLARAVIDNPATLAVPKVRRAAA